MTATIIVVASGPSLTQQQCDYAMGSGYPILSVCNTYNMVPSAQWSYACDFAWWKIHAESNKIANRYTISQSAAAKFGLKLVNLDASSANSGSQSILLAGVFGAKRIVLLGFDFQHTGGKRHYFGDHPSTLRNAPGCGTWLARLPKVIDRIHKEHRAHVINCSEETAIPEALIPRAKLGEIL